MSSTYPSEARKRAIPIPPGHHVDWCVHGGAMPFGGMCFSTRDDLAHPECLVPAGYTATASDMEQRLTELVLALALCGDKCGATITQDGRDPIVCTRAPLHDDWAAKIGRGPDDHCANTGTWWIDGPDEPGVRSEPSLWTQDLVDLLLLIKDAHS